MSSLARERTLVGVDFSGARGDANTWVAQARLGAGGLEILSAERMSRRDLAGLLAGLPPDAVAALDFPFGLPWAFAKAWRPEAVEMPDLWRAAAEMGSDDREALGRFVALRDGFVAAGRNPEYVRVGDRYFPGSFSPLHKVNPNMLPMTFLGMRMLHRLWTETACRVPPLPAAGRRERARTGPVLLEAMPGASLGAFGLPPKGYKTGRRAGERRTAIVASLEAASGVALPNLRDFAERCSESHDCLDSVVAAVTAALWATGRERFRVPAKTPPPDAGPTLRPASPGVEKLDEQSVARLEGWLYAPAGGFIRGRSGGGGWSRRGRRRRAGSGR